MATMFRYLPVAFVACLAVAGCGGQEPSTPAPPSTGQPPPSGGGGVRVSAGDRLGWSQQAGSAAEVATYQYAIYVDGTRSVLGGATCAAASGGGFDCNAVLPIFTAGNHTLELAAFVQGASILESARSAPLQVTAAGLSSTGLPTSMPVQTAEQVRLNLDLVADGLHLPTDLAFAPDGAIFIAELGGLVRVLRDGVILPEPALDLSGEVSIPEGGLLALAVDSGFDRNGVVYSLFTERTRGRGSMFTLARFRSVRDSFGERAILLDRVPTSGKNASGALRIGPDGKLYVGFDNGEGGRTPGLASYNGKILRLNTDATTPEDQAGNTPIYSADHPLPRAVDWQPSSGELWVVDAVEPSSGRLTALRAGRSKKEPATVTTTYEIPAGTGAASAAFYRGNLLPVFRDNLFIAADTGRHLMRLQFDRQHADRIVSAERLLQDQIGAVRVVATGPDGALYVCSATSLWRLAP